MNRTRHRSRSRHRHAPPWWPQGEDWPPRGPPWRFVPGRFRRRLLVAALGVLLLLVGIGVAVGLALSGKGGPWRHGPGNGSAPGEWRGGPWAVFGFAGFVAVIAGGATVVAYRRISRPLGDLLGAAERLAGGDYGARVDVDGRGNGPRELRTLGTTFNDMAARLEASDEQRRRFLADVTHELRTPLAVLQSGIEAQLDGVHPRDDRHLDSLLEEAQLLGRLIDDLHTLALADAGRLTLHREQTHPRALLEEAVESHAALAERKGVTITPSVPDGLPEVDVDPSRIRQVLGNLLSNAVRHTPPGGQVRVGVEQVPGGASLRFTVADSGSGFPADQVPHLFERFTRSADSRGSGLGLSIARDLVRAHGGDMHAGNQPGGGAALEFTLPAGGG